MSFNLKENEVINDLVIRFSDGTLSLSENEMLTDLMSCSPIVGRYIYAGRFCKKALSKLREIKARPGFEQKMAALFAMELQNEQRELSKKRFQKQEILS